MHFSDKHLRIDKLLATKNLAGLLTFLFFFDYFYYNGINNVMSISALEKIFPLKIILDICIIAIFIG